MVDSVPLSVPVLASERLRLRPYRPDVLAAGTGRPALRDAVEASR